MLYFWIFHLILVAFAFLNTVAISFEDLPKENVNSIQSIKTTTKKPNTVMDAPRLGLSIPNNAAEDSKCAYTNTLFQLLALLLEFLYHSPEYDKVSKVVTVMKNYLESTSHGHDKDMIFDKLKVVENELLRNRGPLHDYFTAASSNVKSKTTIVFKNDVPYLENPLCKEWFSDSLLKAYNMYLDVAKYPNCQSSLQSEVHLPYNIYPFDITSDHLPSRVFDHGPSNVGFPPFNAILSPKKKSREDSIYPLPDVLNSNPSYGYIHYMQEPINKPLEKLTASKPLDVWSIINNDSPQYRDLNNKYVMDQTELLPGVLSTLNQATNDFSTKENYPFSKQYPGNFSPITEPQVPIISNVTFPESNVQFNVNDLNQWNIPDKWYGINGITPMSPNQESDNLIKVQPPSGKNSGPNNNVEYGGLLDQLGLTPASLQKNPYGSGLDNIPVNSFSYQNDDSQSNLGNLYNPYQNLETPISSTTNLKNPKFNIPIRYDRVTVNHDMMPYILEYMASLKNSANPNINVGKQNGNYENHVYGNMVSPDLPQDSGITNPIKLVNKAGIVELTYILKSPQPLFYNPVYYVKYRLPYLKFIENYKNIISQKPLLRSEPVNIYKELIYLSNITDMSPNLNGFNKNQILKLIVNSGALIKAKLVDGKDEALNEQLEIIQDLNSNTTLADINELTNATINHADLLNTIKKNSDSDPFAVPVQFYRNNTTYVNKPVQNLYTNNQYADPNTNYVQSPVVYPKILYDEANVVRPFTVPNLNRMWPSPVPYQSPNQQRFYSKFANYQTSNPIFNRYLRG